MNEVPMNDFSLSVMLSHVVPTVKVIQKLILNDHLFSEVVKTVKNLIFMPGHD